MRTANLIIRKFELGKAYHSKEVERRLRKVGFSYTSSCHSWEKFWHDDLTQILLVALDDATGKATDGLLVQGSATEECFKKAEKLTI